MQLDANTVFVAMMSVSLKYMRAQTRRADIGRYARGIGDSGSEAPGGHGNACGGNSRTDTGA